MFKSNVPAVQSALQRYCRMRNRRLRRPDAIVQVSRTVWYARFGDRWTSNELEWHRYGAKLPRYHYAVEALELLGMITAKDAAEHKLWAAEEQRREWVRSQFAEMCATAKELGYRVIGGRRRRIRAARVK